MWPASLRFLPGRRDARTAVDAPRWRAAVQVGATLAACTATAALLEPVLQPANLVLVFLVGVVDVGARLGRAPAVATVLGSVALYDLLFVPPRWSFKPADPQVWFAFGVLLVVGLMLGSTAARTRRQALLATARAERAQVLHRLSAALGSSSNVDTAARALAEAVARLPVGHPVVLLAGEAGLAPAGRAAAGAPGPAAGGALAAEAAAQAALPDPAEGADLAELAGRALALGREQQSAPPASSAPRWALRGLPLQVGDRRYGVLVLRSDAAAAHDEEDLELVRALAGRAALAMERTTLERRVAEAALQAEAERLRSTLLAGLSHDFRTPLTTIVGCATTLIEQSQVLDDARRSALLHGLLSQARRLHTLTSNLLDLTRLDEGAVQIRPEWCPAEDLLEETLGHLRPQLAGVRLSTRVAPDTVVWCDPRLVGQVLANLVENAVRHSPPGGEVRITLSAAPDHWTLGVADDGEGVAPGQEQAVFRKFHRAGAEGEGEGAGRGLGLAICAAVARLHGGRIEVSPGRGAMFRLTLPQPAPPELAREGAE